MPTSVTDMAMAEHILVTDELIAGYEEIIVLNRVSVAIPQGKITSIIGSNGAGKSTLLKAIFGMAKHYGGTITYQGRAIHRTASANRLRAGISIVLQGRVNFPLMTVTENLEMGAFIDSSVDVRGEIRRLQELFPLLREKRDELAGNLSGGQQQVLEMAMALMLQPKVLMLDEPSLGLAPKTMDEVFAAVREINRTGCTVVMVEQNARKALAISDYAFVLDLGQKRFEGPAHAILENAAVRKAYLGG